MAHRSGQRGAATRVAIGIGSLLVIAAMLGGCGSAASGPPSTVGGPVSGQPAEAPAAMPSAAAAAAQDGTLGAANSGAARTASGAGVAALDTGGPLIVRTGQLDLQVADLEGAIRAAEAAVTAVGGRLVLSTTARARAREPRASGVGGLVSPKSRSASGGMRGAQMQPLWVERIANRHVAKMPTRARRARSPELCMRAQR